MAYAKIEDRRAYHRGYERKWRRDNPERFRERFRVYQSKNRERLNTYMRQYRKDNAAKFKEYHREASRKHRLKYPNEYAEKGREYHRAHYMKNRTLKREQHLIRSYGITIKMFNKMLKEQGGCCAICKNKKRRWVVDHCHNNGHIRGILCVQCNAAIGLFKHCPSVAESARDYLL